MVPVKLASPTIASTDADGMPFVQLLEVDHEVLVVPFQLVWALVNKEKMREEENVRIRNKFMNC